MICTMLWNTVGSGLDSRFMLRSVSSKMNATALWGHYLQTVYFIAISLNGIYSQIVGYKIKNYLYAQITMLTFDKM